MNREDSTVEVRSVSTTVSDPRDVARRLDSRDTAAAVDVVGEEPAGDGVPLYRHPGWAAAFPWLVQGTTGRGDGVPFDLRLGGEAPVGAVLGRWRALGRAAGCHRVVCAYQVHGSHVTIHDDGPPGLAVVDAGDGHATRAPGVLLAVSVADCVPIFLVDAERRAVALLHGGWRGVAAGILEAGIEAMDRLAGSPPSSLYVHLGPAICGDCYEVGPEVHEALGRPVPAGPTPIDLRDVLVRRAVAMGIPAGQITRSAYCTRCGSSPFFSHRRGDAGRQVAILGVAPGATRDVRARAARGTFAVTWPGKCAACRHARVIENRRGSRFHLCERSRTDPTFARFPRLPVVRCEGYEPRPGAVEREPAAG